MAPKRTNKSLSKTRQGNGNRSETKGDAAESGSLRSTLDPKNAGKLSQNQGDKQKSNISAGDLEGLETNDSEDFESVAELAEEGQNLEAEKIESIARASNPEHSELKPRKVPEPVKPRKFADRNRI